MRERRARSMMLLVLNATTVASAAAPPSLDCFTEEPASAPGPNVCFQKYPTKAKLNLTACAQQCIDTKCDQFVFASALDCRLSHDCPKPTSHLAGFDGYLRKPGPGCGAGPTPTPPPAPVPPSPPPTGLHFGNSSNPSLFAPGMILQRGGAKVWGAGAVPSSTVTVSVVPSLSGEIAVTAVAQVKASPSGDWMAVITAVAAQSVTLKASDGTYTATLTNVAIGDVVLCGGQSNMGFGMCGATSKTQTPQQAFDMVAEAKLRLFFQEGSGPNGGAGGRGCPTSHPGEKSITPALQWLTLNRTNVGGASAVCVLTAHRLALATPGVPIGMVESCVSGTPVGDWTPPTGSLWKAHMIPLLPMTFRLALWDQGEADAKRTSSKYYATEFPLMIQRWRENFHTPLLPFFYVELCSEYGAEEPKESDFWYAQRSALALPMTGFATTTDIQRALHPPDKQDVAARLLLEIQRVAYGMDVISRGPELVSSHFTDGRLTATFSNASLITHAGLFVGSNVTCAASASNNSAVVQFPKMAANCTNAAFTKDVWKPGGDDPIASQCCCSGEHNGHSEADARAECEAAAKQPGESWYWKPEDYSHNPFECCSKVGAAVAVAFEISGATLTIACDPDGGAVHVNADASSCFVFGGAAPFLPATPIELNCSAGD